jgi:hypothetical protein
MTTGERRLLLVSVGGTALTGFTVWVMKDLLPRRDPFSVLGHPWQPHVLAAHLLVAPVVVFALGLIAREHIVQGYRYSVNGDGRRSGILTVLWALPMILSGYLLQISTGDATRRFLSVGHLVTGALFTALFVGHLVRALRRRAAAAKPGQAPAPAARLDRPRNGG